MHQHYLLSQLEKLVRVDLKELILQQKQIDKNYFSFITNDVISQKREILSSFRQHFYGIDNQHQAVWYVQQHQHQLIMLLDQINTYLPQDTATSKDTPHQEATWENLIEIIHNNIRELLTFIERDFKRYLDTDFKIPDSTLLSEQTLIAGRADFISSEFKKYGIDEGLLSIILLPFENFMTVDYRNRPISYHQLFYLQDFERNLVQLLAYYKGDANITEKLKDMLHYLNFNNVCYFRYWADSIGADLRELQTTREKRDWLLLMKKKLNQKPVKPDIAFSKKNLPLQNQLDTWLSIEIDYQTEKETSISYDHLPDELRRWKDFKIKTPLSVAQLANLIKLFVDKRIFVNENKKEVLDFLAFFFSSTKQNNISPASLRKNFYNDDAGVSKIVRGLLIDMAHNS
ncbi:hypothetical protein HF324_31045 [Chitinophaga oryzae]|uniref:Uncharacterized protein n=1 Tax=Chitinophaga oryzae TaxID=2725414 RepID=A0AAE6ZPB0_9BACT|nr:hypothetical protein [Chitinophaga oryzae]QJB35500.1 hypothetical protein HF329_31025 [Chitinophaga oryzae]QJB42043.1 hypothetical protein HF324_31045 [Chitinophaga oryzae]